MNVVKLASATLLGLVLSSPAQAGLFDGLFGSKGIACAPRDRACIMEAALTIALQDYQSRDYKPNFEPHAKAGGRLMQLVPEDQQLAVRERWTKAGADAVFFETFDEAAKEGREPQGLTIDVLRQALTTGTAPDNGDFGKFLRSAFPVLLRQAPKEAVALWEQHAKLLWKSGFDALTETLDWVALNDVEALERFSQEYYFPKSGFYDPWDRLTLAAANRCDSGDRTGGERVLAVLERDKDSWKAERELKAIDWSKLTYGVLHCRGEAAAMAMIEPLFRQMDADIAIAEAKYQNEQERTFVLGVIRSEVAENLIQPLVLRLNDQGRRAEALALYTRLPGKAMSVTPEDVAEKGILGAEFIEQSFDELIDLHRYTAFYGEAGPALAWYVKSYNPAFAICCVERQLVEGSVEKIEERWPDPIARLAAEKTLKLLAEIKAKDPDYGYAEKADLASLRFAALERSSDGCDLSDDRLQNLLQSVAQYQFDSQKVDTLSAYIKFLDAKPGAKTGACIIK